MNKKSHQNVTDTALLTTASILILLYLSNYTYKCYILQRRDQNGIRLQYYRRKIKRGKGK